MLAVIVNETQPIPFEYMCSVKRADAMQSVAEEFGVVIEEKVLREGERFSTPHSSNGHAFIVPEGSVFLRFSQENGNGSMADFWQRVKEIEDSTLLRSSEMQKEVD